MNTFWPQDITRNKHEKPATGTGHRCCVQAALTIRRLLRIHPLRRSGAGILFLCVWRAVFTGGDQRRHAGRISHFLGASDPLDGGPPSPTRAFLTGETGNAILWVLDF